MIKHSHPTPTTIVTKLMQKDINYTMYVDSFYLLRCTLTPTFPIALILDKINSL